MALTEERVIELIQIEIAKTENALAKFLEGGRKLYRRTTALSWGRGRASTR